MRKSFGIVTAISAFVLTQGCASVRTQPMSIPVNQSVNVTAKILKSDFDGNLITRGEIDNAVVSKLHVGYTNKIERCATNDCGMLEKGGVDITPSDNNINVTYFHGDYFRNSGRTTYSLIKADIPYSVTEDDNYYVVSLKPPQAINTVPTLDVMKIFTISYYIDPAKTPDDVITKINNLNPLEIHKNYVLKGEINSTYNSESIYSNFKRILGQYRFGSEVKMDDIEKKNYFAFKHNNQDLRLKLSVFPYRNGSKAVYELVIPYTISETMTLSKKDLASIQGSIEKVVND